MEEKKNREGKGGKHFEKENLFWEEKEKEEIIWRRKINGDANQPTNRVNIVQPASSNARK